MKLAARCKIISPKSKKEDVRKIPWNWRYKNRSLLFSQEIREIGYPKEQYNFNSYFHEKFVKLSMEEKYVIFTDIFWQWVSNWNRITKSENDYWPNIDANPMNFFFFFFFFFCLSTIINCVLRISSRKISCVVWRIHDVIKKGYKRQKIVHHVTEKHSNRIP